ncbi:hypothetical protein [uncultured Sphingomonas sp.]|uniref:hypothetical protein n=1 Tax=uncultured Sphingomonas sp. TaxID=158754 RepID=UPI0035CA4F0D
MTGIDRRLRALPASLRRSLTLDRGIGLAGYGLLQQRLDVLSSFASRRRRGKKGSVENGNGRIRRFLLLDKDLARIPDEELTLVAS